MFLRSSGILFLQKKTRLSYSFIKKGTTMLIYIQLLHICDACTNKEEGVLKSAQ